MLNPIITSAPAQNNSSQPNPSTSAHLAARSLSPRHKAQIRRVGGKSCNRLAYLVVEGQTQGFSCSIGQFSPDGAQLTVSGLMGIPEKFNLYVEPDAVRYECQVTLRKGNSVRVAFKASEQNARYRDLQARR